MKQSKRTSLEVQGTAITVVAQRDMDFISLTDMARKFGDDSLIYSWMRNRNSLEFIGIWEKIHNPGFKGIEFETFRKLAGLNSFSLTPRKWIEATGAIGFQSRAGRYGGGTFAHKDIAFEFGSWLSPEFKLYLIKEFQRLKDEENERLKLGWNLQRTLAKNPLYAFVRRSGHSPQDAEDLTQAFFARLLDKNYLAAADREKGRFRSFLLVALKRFLANEWERQHALKRGGYATVVAIDQDDAESRYGGDPGHTEQPDVLLEKQWAMALIGQVMGRLQAEYGASGRGEVFDFLRASLTRDDSAIGYAEIATRLGTTTPAVKMAAMRLRDRYQALLREEIARTVVSPAEIDDEIRYLFSVFSR